MAGHKFQKNFIQKKYRSIYDTKQKTIVLFLCNDDSLCEIQNVQHVPCTISVPATELFGPNTPFFPKSGASPLRARVAATDSAKTLVTQHC